MLSRLIVLFILSLFGFSNVIEAKEWATPEALRAFGSPGDTVRDKSATETTKKPHRAKKATTKSIAVPTSTEITYRESQGPASYTTNSSEAKRISEYRARENAEDIARIVEIQRTKGTFGGFEEIRGLQYKVDQYNKEKYGK